MTQLTQTTAEAVAEFEAQGVLQPGDEGWWKVWGAQVRHIRTGDLLLCKNQDDETEFSLIHDTFLAKSHPLRRGFISDDQEFTLGVLSAIVLLRRGTHNMLAD